EKTNNVRFLRHQYVDPMTGKVDWRPIPVGEAKTTVKGFFGQPLAGIASSGIGSAAGSGFPAGTAGSASGSSSITPFGGSSFGSTDSSSGSGGQSSSSGPFVGVGLVKDGNSITVLNEQTTYATWEFIYDARIEQML